MRKIGFVFVLLVFVATAAPPAVRAQAASGWILWEKFMRMKAGSETVTWEPQDGFESLAECRAVAQQLLQAALAYMKDGGGGKLLAVRPDGRSAAFTVTDGGVQGTLDIRYVCFPGAFDPRGRAAVVTP